MPQVEIMIGGRSFEVACQDGEETFLRAAAHMLDTEANALSNQIGRMPESRMLLMSGLMLADKTAALEDQLREAEAKLAAMGEKAEAAPTRVEVPVIPSQVTDMLADVAAQAESLADMAERKAN